MQKSYFTMQNSYLSLFYPNASSRNLENIRLAIFDIFVCRCRDLFLMQVGFYRVKIITGNILPLQVPGQITGQESAPVPGASTWSKYLGKYLEQVPVQVPVHSNKLSDLRISLNYSFFVGPQLNYRY